MTLEKAKRCFVMGLTPASDLPGGKYCLLIGQNSNEHEHKS